MLGSRSTKRTVLEHGRTTSLGEGMFAVMQPDEVNGQVISPAAGVAYEQMHTRTRVQFQAGAKRPRPHVLFSRTSLYSTRPYGSLSPDSPDSPQPVTPLALTGIAPSGPPSYAFYYA